MDLSEFVTTRHELKRPHQVSFGVLLLLVTMVNLAQIAMAHDQPLNVLFILTEDQGDQLSFNGTKGLETPHMDALARGGVYFGNAFVTYPVCSASKAAIYTGLHSHTNGLMGNTANLFKPASQLQAADRKGIYQRNQIRAELPTLIECLHSAGYFTGVSGKLHVAPNEKFPYDMFVSGKGGDPLTRFLNGAKASGKPWFMLHNISITHRPYPDSDKEALGVDPNEVNPPPFLPDTTVIRQDWSEYLAAIERGDQQVGQARRALEQSGEAGRTIIIFMGDHGPCFQRGKMNLHDFGLRVPLAICGPGIVAGKRTDALVSEIDLLPTIVDLLDLQRPDLCHGLSLRPILEQQETNQAHKLIFAEISDDGPLPNQGMQERSVFDGRFHLIYRENLNRHRQVNADLRDWKPWRNRAYKETVKQREQFPLQYEMLREMDPQRLGGKAPQFELYDLSNDPNELKNLAIVPTPNNDHLGPQRRLYEALRKWSQDTHDPGMRYDARF